MALSVTLPDETGSQSEIQDGGRNDVVTRISAYIHDSKEIPTAISMFSRSGNTERLVRILYSHQSLRVARPQKILLLLLNYFSIFVILFLQNFFNNNNLLLMKLHHCIVETCGQVNQEATDWINALDASLGIYSNRLTYASWNYVTNLTEYNADQVSSSLLRLQPLHPAC